MSNTININSVRTGSNRTPTLPHVATHPPTDVKLTLLPRFPIVVHDILSALVVTVVMASPFVFTKRCGTIATETTRKVHEQNLMNLKYDVTPAPYWAKSLVLPFLRTVFVYVSYGGFAREMVGRGKTDGMGQGRGEGEGGMKLGNWQG